MHLFSYSGVIKSYQTCHWSPHYRTDYYKNASREGLGARSHQATTNMTEHQDPTNVKITNIECVDSLELKSILSINKSLSLKMMLLNPWSINSLRKFNNFVMLLGYLDANFDIMVLPESWICESMKQLYNINGYNALHSCRDDTGKGGVVIYIRKEHVILDSKIIYEHQYNIIQVDVKLNNSETMNIIALYRPPGMISTDVSYFLSRLEQLLSNNNMRKCVIMGDMNFDPKDNTMPIIRYLNILESFSFKICNENVTREASRTKLDHVCTNFYEEKEHLILTCPLQSDDILKTDHSIVSTLIDFSIQGNPRTSTTQNFESSKN